ncbi:MULTISPECIES: hypothetical protein [Nocardiopsidaceae]|uniref:Uncharacterized protein n=1 Tax=Streptomonospora nanhaiensis TaxID=1323731 RepID=A0ABY6YNZ9_9ACTN|nr:hypothetical protein [Streptomonospora nanhaiensis]WAE74117.1 hypothetical protein OUQ99_03030 [Streptomonospora nanhaiensis]
MAKCSMRNGEGTVVINTDGDGSGGGWSHQDVVTCSGCKGTGEK